MKPPPTPGRQRRRRGSVPLVAAAALLAGAGGAAGTAALWATDGSAPLGEIIAGDLDLDLLGPARWQETSADVAATPRQVSPTAFLARPGDTVAVQQQFTTELRGDNMLGLLTVDWDRAPVLPAGASATYTVRDDSGGAVVHDVPLGESATLDALDSDDDGRTDVFTLEVTIGLSAAMTDRVGPAATPQVTDIGPLVLTLDQVRPGEEGTP